MILNIFRCINLITRICYHKQKNARSGIWFIVIANTELGHSPVSLLGHSPTFPTNCKPSNNYVCISISFSFASYICICILDLSFAFWIWNDIFVLYMDLGHSPEQKGIYKNMHNIKYLNLNFNFDLYLYLYLYVGHFQGNKLASLKVVTSRLVSNYDPPSY